MVEKFIQIGACMKKSSLSPQSAMFTFVFGISLACAPICLAQNPSDTPAPKAPAATPAAAPTATPATTPAAAPDMDSAEPQDQMAPPPNAPMDIPPEFKAPAPSTTWSADEKSALAVAQATAIVKSFPARYSAIPALEETMIIRSPQFQGQDQKVQLLATKSGDAKVIMPGITLTRLNDQVYVEMDGRPKYAQMKQAGSAAKALGEVMGGKLPLPTLILLGGDSADVAAAMTLGQNPDMFPSGFRAGVDGKPDQILMIDPQGTEVVAFIDPKTGLLASINMSLTNPKFPPGLRLPMSITFERKVYDAGLPTPIAFDPAGRKMTDTLDSLDQPFDVGDAAPDFVLQTLEGGKITLADLKGKVVVLDFWATWCKPCMMALPLLDTFAKWASESGKPIAVYGVNVMEQVDKQVPNAREKMVGDFWKGKAFSFSTLIDFDEQVGKDYKLTGIPFTVVITPNGKIAAIHMGFDEKSTENLKKDVEAALATKG